MVKMKYKISISISEETFQMIEKNVDGDTFRNKSHLIEYAIKKLMENRKF